MKSLGVAIGRNKSLLERFGEVEILTRMVEKKEAEALDQEPHGLRY